MNEMFAIAILTEKLYNCDDRSFCGFYGVISGLMGDFEDVFD
jgi:hypothetical protein